jgi:hypothetical protein
MTKDYAVMVLKDAQAKLLEVVNCGLHFEPGTPGLNNEWRRGRASGSVDSAYWAVGSALNFILMSGEEK